MEAALQVETFLPFTTFVVQVFARLDGTLTEILAVVPFSTAVAFAPELTAGADALGAATTEGDFDSTGSTTVSEFFAGATGDAGITGAAVGVLAEGVRGISGATLGSSGCATNPDTRA
jgi:hypothetical protein